MSLNYDTIFITYSNLVKVNSNAHYHLAYSSQTYHISGSVLASLVSKGFLFAQRNLAYSDLLLGDFGNAKIG